MLTHIPVMSSSTPLLRLPLEMLTNIIDRLHVQDRICLAMTNRYLRSIIEPPTHEEFLQAETSEWAISKQLLTCKDCVQFRKFAQFSDDMRKGKRARRGLAAKSRFCIRCGVERGWYSEGVEITVAGVLGRLCRTLTDHNGPKPARGSPVPGWTLIRIGKTHRYTSNHSFANEDDWAYSTRCFVEGRHTEEICGYWLDI